MTDMKIEKIYDENGYRTWLVWRPCGEFIGTINENSGAFTAVREFAKEMAKLPLWREFFTLDSAVAALDRFIPRRAKAVCA